MKRLFITYLLCGVYFNYVTRLTTNGQYFEEVARSFQNFTLQEQHRGTFNMNLCLKELFNCWEYMPMEMTCERDDYYQQNIRYDSVCSIMYKECWDKDSFFYADWGVMPYQVSVSDCY